MCICRGNARLTRQTSVRQACTRIHPIVKTKRQALLNSVELRVRRVTQGRFLIFAVSLWRVVRADSRVGHEVRPHPDAGHGDVPGAGVGASRERRQMPHQPSAHPNRCQDDEDIQSPVDQVEDEAAGECATVVALIDSRDRSIQGLMRGDLVDLWLEDAIGHPSRVHPARRPHSRRSPTPSRQEPGRSVRRSRPADACRMAF